MTGFSRQPKKDISVLPMKTCNIMDVAKLYKGNYRMDFKDKKGKTVSCRLSFIPLRLCEFPSHELVLVAVYGFGTEPMLLLTSLRMQEKNSALS